MQRFRFELQAVLRLREGQEDQAMARLADANADEQAALAAVARTDSEIALAAGRTPASVQGQLQQEIYLQRLDGVRDQRAWQAAQAADARAQAAHDAAQAQAQRKAVVRLRDRRKAEHALDMLRAEDVTLNEVAMSRRHRETQAAGR